MGRISIEQLQVKGQTFNIWEIPSLGAFGAGRALRWVKTAADSFRVSYPWLDGVEVVAVVPDLLGQFAVSCTFQPASGPVRQRTLVHGVASSALAADFAEKYVASERPNVMKLVGSEAKWRNDPASERQKGWLRWKRIPFSADIRKGAAADLMNLVRARSGQ